jgi:DNA-binding response OmpR family regulator
MPSVVLADREQASRAFLEEHLRDDGFEILPQTAPRPDVVIASDDVDLRRWRGEAPVIVLGRAEAEPIERVQAFRSGCDDYVPKPFHYDELVERIRAVLRRAPNRREQIVVRALEIDVGPRLVRLQGVPVKLPQKEFRLLVRLARDPHRVWTKQELLRDVWDYEISLWTRTIDAHACRLRGKLRRLDPSTVWVENVWGVGYRLLGEESLPQSAAA